MNNYKKYVSWNQPVNSTTLPAPLSSPISYQVITSCGTRYNTNKLLS